MEIVLVVAVLVLAYSNGANDNFKGVATLFGSGTARYGPALGWATLTTAAGSLLALVLAQGLVETFRGKGLLPDDVAAQPTFLLCVSLGAACTVLLATWLGLPVSTTHALTGGLVGAALIAATGEVRFAALGSAFLAPLLFSPVFALGLTVMLYPLLHACRRRTCVTAQTCVCIAGVTEEVIAQPDGTLCLVRTGELLRIDEPVVCQRRYQGRVVGIEVGRALDGLHYLSGGAVGFARGLNDTPKILAALMVSDVLSPQVGLVLVVGVMALGGLINARRVAETMSKKITPMSPGQGLTANLVTAGLVAGASRLGLPVSTTHVSVGALFGIGLITREARIRTILGILLAWVTTLPLAAVLAALATWTTRVLAG
jgi:PiT family inorganic phosphate transporter